MRSPRTHCVPVCFCKSKSFHFCKTTFLQQAGSRNRLIFPSLRSRLEGRGILSVARITVRRKLVILIIFVLHEPWQKLYRKVMEHFTGILALSFAMLTGCYVAGMLPLSLTLSEVGISSQILLRLFSLMLFVFTL